MICNDCGNDRPERSFELVKGVYRRGKCVTCRKRDRYRKNPEAVLAGQHRRRLRSPDLYVLIDSRSSDKKKGRAGNDLTREFVRELLSKHCSYCGESSLRMTLDRKDNEKAHTKDNVVPACIRCNYLRRDMPLEAWLSLVPSIRETKELGLFGSWGSNPMKRKQKPSEEGPKRNGGVAKR
jgi:hypothetical protein